MIFINRLICLLFSPKSEWEKIKIEKTNFTEIIKTFLIYLILIQIISSILKILIAGPYKGLNFITSILFAILVPFLGLIFIYLSSKIVNAFALKFGAEKNINNSIKVTSYCSATIVISTILQLIPVKYIGILSLFYLVYLRYYGLKIIMGSKSNTLVYAMIPEIFILLFSLLLYILGFVLQNVLYPMR